MKKTSFISLLFFLFTITVVARNETIEGKILDNKKPVSAIPVNLSNSDNKTFTNKKGNFSIRNVDIAKDTLIVFLESDTLIIPLNGTDIITIQLQGDTTFIQQSNRKQTHASYGGTVVTRESLEQTGETNLLRAVAMRVAGVEYRNGNLVIRGIGSIKLTSDPLYVINGVQTYDASYLTVLEVESVEVIKDTNTSMFGVKGANGVVIINLR